MEPALPPPTFSAPGRYPEYFLANEDFLSTKSSQTMDYDMESKVLHKLHRLFLSGVDFLWWLIVKSSGESSTPVPLVDITPISHFQRIGRGGGMFSYCSHRFSWTSQPADASVVGRRSLFFAV